MLFSRSSLLGMLGVSGVSESGSKSGLSINNGSGFSNISSVHSNNQFSHHSSVSDEVFIQVIIIDLGVGWLVALIG